MTILMSVLAINFVVVEERPLAVSKRTWSDWSKAGMHAAGSLWEARYKRLHFENSARSRYRYQKRKFRYIEQKLRRAQRGLVKDGGKTDLVYTGFLRDVIARRNHFVRAFPTRLTITMPAPRYVRFRPRGGQPWKARELTMTTRDEEQAMAKAYKTSILRKWKRFRRGKRERL